MKKLYQKQAHERLKVVVARAYWLQLGFGINYKALLNADILEGDFKAQAGVMIIGIIYAHVAYIF